MSSKCFYFIYNCIPLSKHILSFLSIFFYLLLKYKSPLYKSIGFKERFLKYKSFNYQFNVRPLIVSTFHGLLHHVEIKEKFHVKISHDQRNSRVDLHAFHIFIFIAVIKNAGLAERGELGSRERRTRNVGGRGAKKSEENGHVSDTLAWESRIADRELPICRTIASLALTSPFILTPGRLLSREWGSLILPRRERTHRGSVTSIRAYYAAEEIILYPGNRTETESASALGLYLPHFSFRKIARRACAPHRYFVRSNIPN